MDEGSERKNAVAIAATEPVKTEGLLPSPDTSEPSEAISSPPPNCSICLGKLINTSFTDSCLHQFCFTCLLQWSKIKTECPLCKQTFKSIIHNVRSEEDYDQYHVPPELTPQLPSSQVGATLDVNFELVGGVAEVGLRRFVYRTTMTPNRRFGVLLNPEQVARRVQLPNIMAPTVSREERRYRRVNPTGYRRNVYRLGEWSNLLPDVYGRFRECSAEYYRRHPNELNRLIPWINRELQTLLNANEPHIAYVLRVVMDALSRHDMRGAEFRDMVRPYFGQFTDHFVHELLNYARTSFDLVGYDQYVTYPTRAIGVSSEYVTRIISPNSSQSSTSSDDSDIRVLDEMIDVTRNSAEIPSIGPHVVDFPGPSTVGGTFQISPTLPNGPDVLTISSSPSSSEECTVIGYVKPRHERTPEIIELASSGAGSVRSNNNDSNSRTPTPNHDDGERPGPSHGIRRSIYEYCTQGSTRKLSRQCWSTTSSSGTNDDLDSEYSSNLRKKSDCNQSRQKSQRSTRSYALKEQLDSARSPNKINHEQVPKATISIGSINQQSLQRKIDDRTKAREDSLLFSDSETTTSSSSIEIHGKQRNEKSARSKDALTQRTRKGCRGKLKRSRRISSSNNESESDECDELQDPECKEWPRRRKASPDNAASCSTEASPNSNSHNYSRRLSVHATILRKNIRKPDEWYVKKTSSRGTSASSSSSSESKVQIRSSSERGKIRGQNHKLGETTNFGCSDNSGRRKLKDSTAQSRNRYKTVSNRIRTRDRSKSEEGSRKQKIYNGISDSSDDERLKYPMETSMNENGSANRKNSDGTHRRMTPKKKHKNTDRAEKDYALKSSDRNLSNRRRHSNEHRHKGDCSRRKDKTSTSCKLGIKHKRSKASNHTQKYDQNHRSHRAKKPEQVSNSELVRQQNDEPPKFHAQQNKRSRQCTRDSEQDRSRVSRHSLNERESCTRDKHRHKKKQKLKRRRSRSESNSESRHTKHRVARSSSCTAPASKHYG